MRRVVVEQRAALQVVFHQEKPDRGVQQSVQSTPNPSAEPTETRTCWCRELSSSDWRANRSRTASTRERSTHGYLAILDVQSLELGKTARMLEHVLVLEHHAQIHLLQNILHSLLLYLSFSTNQKALNLLSASLCFRLNARIMLASPIVRHTERISPHHFKNALRQRFWR